MNNIKQQLKEIKAQLRQVEASNKAKKRELVKLLEQVPLECYYPNLRSVCSESQELVDTRKYDNVLKLDDNTCLLLDIDDRYPSLDSCLCGPIQPFQGASIYQALSYNLHLWLNRVFFYFS